MGLQKLILNIILGFLNIKKKLGITLDKKGLLDAPTWRDNAYITRGNTFILEDDFNKR